LLQHQGGEGYQMQASEPLRHALIISDQTPKPRLPGKGALDNPATRQQHEAAFGLSPVDDVQLNAVRLGGLDIAQCAAVMVNEAATFLPGATFLRKVAFVVRAESARTTFERAISGE
jgi:hypothetical protein